MAQFIRHERRKSRLAILYEVIEGCAPDEIVALIDGKDWLSHENVFDHLNCAYANPEVWMTYSRALSHPYYKKVWGAPLKELSLSGGEGLRKGGARECTSLLTFYAGLFQRVTLEDLLYQGHFIDEKFMRALQLPLFEMGGAHALFMDEVSYVMNESRPLVDHQLHLAKGADIESHLHSLPPYAPLSQPTFLHKTPSSYHYTSDLLLFSEDTPMHLYASLEALFLRAKGLNDIYVIYKAGDSELQRAYLNVQSSFHGVTFLNVCDYPGNDYATLVQKAFTSRPHSSPYLLLAQDCALFNKGVDIHAAIAALEKVHANHFLFSLCTKHQGSLLPLLPVGEGISAYQVGEKGACPSFEAALCRKELFRDLDQMTDLSSFKKMWRATLSPSSVALLFDDKRLLSYAKEMTKEEKREWGRKFLEGFKIDLSAPLTIGEALPLAPRETLIADVAN